MKRAHQIAVVAFITSVGFADAAFGQGDFYIRAQYSNGTFTGFHEILTKPETGYHSAQYCDRIFWVSSNTVAWTEEQVAAGQTLVLEENLGSNRRVVCADSSSFATLDDLGLKKKEVDKIRGKSTSGDMKSSRIRTIRDAFKQFK